MTSISPAGHAFLKMHGLGNDFVVLDARSRPLALTETAVRAIADRKTGVGCDQLIVMEASQDRLADVHMAIFNADGSEVAACGNASRCVAWVMSWSFFASGIEGLGPRPGASLTNPATPRDEKRRSHRITDGRLTPSSAAAASWLRPCARASTIRARPTRRCGVVGALIKRSNSQR